jgi:Ser/Thr protein kinase RdoA (MazF antagonist)
VDELLVGGFRWQVQPGYRDRLFGPGGLRLDEWLRGGQAAIVKHGPHRTVYRVDLPELSFYLKHYRLHDVRAYLRELVRPAKARMEYDRARAVAQCGVPTALPLAVGQAAATFPPGDSFLISRSLDGTEPLSAFLEVTLPRTPAPFQAQVRQALAEELARFVARMHDGGVLHNDFHPGNLLVRLDGDRPRLFLIDLHAVQLRQGPLRAHAARTNLVMLNRWFSMRASRTDRLRFWKAYCRARPAAAGTDWRAEARHLERRTWLSNLGFWSGRDRRCRASNRYYQRLRTPTAAGYAVRDLDQAALHALVADPDEPFRREGVRLLKDARSSTVAELDLPLGEGSQRVIYKRFRVTAWSDPWVALARPSAAVRSWVNGHGLRERALPTPRPLAVFHRHARGLPTEGYLITEKIPGAIELNRFVAALGTRPADERRFILRRLIEQLARLVRELHRRLLSHRDLKATNVLVQSLKSAGVLPPPQFSDPSFGRLWLIDLVGVRRHRKLRRSRKAQNLARLHASFCRTPLLTRTDKLRFLRVYLQWGLFGRAGWKGWWRAIEDATHAKIERNRRSGRPLS